LTRLVKATVAQENKENENEFLLHQPSKSLLPTNTRAARVVVVTENRPHPQEPNAFPERFSQAAPNAEHLLKRRCLVPFAAIYYCKEPSCNVVYFSNENAPFFTTDDVAVKVCQRSGARFRFAIA
jgi:hypothetical protein